MLRNLSLVVLLHQTIKEEQEQKNFFLFFGVTLEQLSLQKATFDFVEQLLSNFLGNLKQLVESSRPHTAHPSLQVFSKQ